MHEMQTIVTEYRGVCPSRGSTQLHCAKTVERIKIRFGVNTGGLRNIVLDGVLISDSDGKGVGKNFAHCGLQHISEMAACRDFKLLWGSY